MEKENQDKQKKLKSQNQVLIDEIGENRKKVEKTGFLRHLWELGKRGDNTHFTKGPGGIIDEYRNFKDIKHEFLEKYTAYETVVQGSTDTLEYYLLLLFSSLIAIFGLFQNSPAVIIGAMIVAPLMGPIFGFSAGVLWGSASVIREAFTTLFKGSLLVIVIAAGIAYFLPGTELTPELLSRSHPSVFDIIIAVSCGFIGAFSYVNKRISSVISGVAIAVALLPPLCTAGVGIGLLNLDLAIGAGLLFAVNLSGIILAASIVFYLVRLHPKSYEKGDKAKAALRALSQIIISLILIALISIPLLYYTDSAITVNKVKRQMIEVIKKEFHGIQIYSLGIQEEQTNEVELILLSENEIDSQEMTSMRSNLISCSDKPIKLRIYVIPARLE